MPRAGLLLFIILVSIQVAIAQPSPQLPKDPYPSVNTPGDANPAAVSDLNAQLIWLMAASPAANDSADVAAARKSYQHAGLGYLGAADQVKLNVVLADFRSLHDAFAAAYNALMPTISRDDVWHEYRDFRIKVNDLVAETFRSINDSFPNSAAQLHTTIEEAKRSINLTTYNSSTDTSYASNARTAATGFAMIQGTVSNAVSRSNNKSPAPDYATAVIVGMVPGCPGKVVPVILPTTGQPPVEGPKTHPWEYVNFQYTTRLAGSPGLGIMVNCEITAH